MYKYIQDSHFYSDPDPEAQKYADPTDPDPQTASQFNTDIAKQKNKDQNDTKQTLLQSQFNKDIAQKNMDPNGSGY